MLGGLAAAAALVVFVTAHEAGHFFAAKATGIKATRFFFGFGPRLWSIKRGETEYGVNLLPLGGFVRIVGMNPLEEVPPQDLGRTYREAKFWQKSVVVLAGVGMNFLLALIMFFVVFMTGGVTEPQPVVDTVVATIDVEGEEVPSPAAVAGLENGDVIVSIAGVTIDQWLDVPGALHGRAWETVEVVVERSGEPLHLTVTLAERADADTGESSGFLGVSPLFTERDAGVFEGIGLAGRQVWDGVSLTFQMFGQMLSPSSLIEYAGVLLGDTDIPVEIRPVSPIGIVNIGSQAEAVGVVNFVAFLAFINVVLATVNVVPLIPLDGGHFAIALYEKMTGRQADIRKLAPVAIGVVGMVAFLTLVAILLDVIDPIRL